eukprot:m.771164 g.771164  ORF g.771164 m.771164 type:complete len:80 (+) comp23244_c0_seq12:2540-2779(+)
MASFNARKKIPFMCETDERNHFNVKNMVMVPACHLPDSTRKQLVSWATSITSTLLDHRELSEIQADEDVEHDQKERASE